YMYWMGRIFGKKSARYLKILPDTSVWLDVPVDSNRLFSRIYLRHPAYNYHPVIGLTYEQAQLYLLWLNDRVYELNLLRADLIEGDGDQDSVNYFSIDRYLSGNYKNHTPDKKIPVPHNRLPSPEDWEKIAFADSVENNYRCGNDKERLLQYNSREFYNLRLENNYDIHSEMPTIEEGGFENCLGLTHFYGNIAEMTSVKGISKGGSWYHSRADFFISKNIAYTEPAAWLGFRAVCTFELPE
ncbi:MAG: SUMF1/EgtB/PvdO family nonheme iron enzyme, partial [Bacteroidota bacterium]|nr:SUMF1/EgtB/PvdO family nonheme iron enzyme [Bacteroidota bacterium]